jgi:hypothetical protein
MKYGLPSLSKVPHTDSTKLRSKIEKNTPSVRNIEFSLVIIVYTMQHKNYFHSIHVALGESLEMA